MSIRSNERIDSTADLVNLTNYLNTCMSETFFKMKQNITEAMQRVLFLLDYYVYNGTILHDTRCCNLNFLHTKSPFYILEEQLQTHSKVFYWPEAMDKIFNKNSARLQMMREQAEEKLIKDRKKFEARLVKILEHLEVYKTKDSPYLSLEEMRVNSENLRVLNDELQTCINTSDVCI